MNQHIHDLKFISQNDKKNVIIFVHGLTGGQETWLRTDGKKSVLEYMLENHEIYSHFDIALFDYFTKITDLLEIPSSLLGKLFGINKRPRINLSIEDISDILETEIRVKCKKYEKVILVSHSMGGLICKNYIIKELENNLKMKVELFISLAVPHQGAQLAVMGSAIVQNAQLTNLSVLSALTDSLTRKWVQKAKDLPKTIYFIGKEDKIVTEESGKAIEANKVTVNYSNDSHSSIICPPKGDSTVITAIIDECLDLVQVDKQSKIISIGQRLNEDPLLTLSINFHKDSNLLTINNTDEYLDLFCEQLLYFDSNQKKYNIHLEIIEETEYKNRILELSTKTQDLEVSKVIFELQRYLDYFQIFRELFIEKIKIFFSLASGSLFTLSSFNIYTKILKQLISFHEISYDGVFSSPSYFTSEKLKTKLEAYTSITTQENQTVELVFSIYLSEEEMKEAFNRNGQSLGFNLFFNSLSYRHYYFLSGFFTYEFINKRIIPSLVESLFKMSRKYPGILEYTSDWKSISNYYIGLG